MAAPIIRGSDTYNRMINQIATVNLEIELFLGQFNEFKKTVNVIDKDLSNTLQNLIESVDKFVDDNPIYLDTQNQTKPNVDFDKNCLKRVVKCEICKCEIGNRYKDIKRHLQDPHHRFRIENPKGNAKKENAPKVKAKNGTVKKKSEEQNLPKKAKAFILENFELKLNKAVKEGIEIKNVPVYGALQKSLLNNVCQEFPDTKIHLFGSRMNGSGNKNSDLDIFLEIDDVFHRYPESRDVIVKKLRKVRKILEKNRPEWTNIISIEDARVPILRTYNAMYNIECDIAFSNGLGSCNTRLLSYFFNLQPICHKMCIFMKKWLELTAFSNRMSTYTIMLMVIFYLQWHEYLPSIEILQADIVNPLYIGPWIGNFAEKTLEELNIQRIEDDEKSLNNHLKKFFDTYANFAYETLMICPYLGKVIEKKNFNSFEKSFPRYFYYYNLDPANNKLQIEKPFCLQDPFEQNHNVGKSINQGMITLLRRFFLLSGQELAGKSKKS